MIISYLAHARPHYNDSKNAISQYIAVGKELASRENLSAQEFAAITPKQLEMGGKQYFQGNGQKMFLSLNTNPVEFAGLITALPEHSS